LAARGQRPDQVSLETMEQLWIDAKNAERNKGG
jgi:hypothetical protein